MFIFADLLIVNVGKLAIKKCPTVLQTNNSLPFISIMINTD